MIVKKDMVSSCLMNKAYKEGTDGNKDYFLKDIVNVFSGTPQGQEIINKVTTSVNRVTDPILDNALDKAVIKFKAELFPMYLLLAGVIITNLLILSKN